MNVLVGEEVRGRDLARFVSPSALFPIPFCVASTLHIFSGLFLLCR